MAKGGSLLGFFAEMTSVTIAIGAYLLFGFVLIVVIFSGGGNAGMIPLLYIYFYGGIFAVLYYIYTLFF